MFLGCGRAVKIFLGLHRLRPDAGRGPPARCLFPMPQAPIDPICASRYAQTSIPLRR